MMFARVWADNDQERGRRVPSDYQVPPIEIVEETGAVGLVLQQTFSTWPRARWIRPYPETTFSQGSQTKPVQLLYVSRSGICSPSTTTAAASSSLSSCSNVGWRDRRYPIYSASRSFRFGYTSVANVLVDFVTSLLEPFQRIGAGGPLGDEDFQRSTHVDVFSDVCGTYGLCWQGRAQSDRASR
jgi:hypothetical protein